jgi:2-polyprenyl-3-methyl-5-hydroxy-6-metoxy-1,4-benzoquinol methylase
MLNRNSNITIDKLERCPICDSVKLQFLFYTYDVQFSITLEKFSLVQCADCGVAFLKERPAQECIGSYYPSASYHVFVKKIGIDGSLRERIKGKIKENLKKRDRNLIDKILLNYVPAYWRLAALFPEGSKILDIGCGGGWKLDLYKEFGWETYGFDVSSEAVEIARAKGHNVTTEQVETITYPDNYFNVIQISHVIEHLPAPVFTIKKAFSLLKEEGVLLLETPNNSSLLAKVFKKDYWQIDSPRHFQVFNIKSLNLLLTNCGFYIDRLITNNSHNGIINSVQAFLTRKQGKSKNIKNNRILKTINAILTILLIPLNKFGLGENIVVFAKKS